jgi:dTDP-4-amino-4,6-dideoxygalactose transaminase
MDSNAPRQADSTVKPQGVPLLDLGRQHRPLREEFLAALGRVCDSGRFVLGPDVEELEAAVARYCRVPHAIGCASGSEALLLALMAVGIGPGDEVILPSFTFFATASAVTRLGARPVFADIDPQTFNLDPEAVGRAVNLATKAILPVHLFGQAADMDAIGRIAEEAGVPVVEDAAQSIGAQWAGRPVGSIGDVGCFSFYPTKNLGGAGDGGMLTTRRDDLAGRLRLLRVHGMEPRYYHKVIGINSRLDSFQAAILNVKLAHLDRWTDQRQANARRYAELFTAAGLEGVVELPRCDPRHLRRHLADARIGSEIYYPLGLHQQECFAYLGYRPGDLPQTERAAAEVLALPIFPELTAAEQEVVVERIASFYRPAPGGHPLAGPKFLTHPAARRNTAGDAKSR